MKNTDSSFRLEACSDFQNILLGLFPSIGPQPMNIADLSGLDDLLSGEAFASLRHIEVIGRSFDGKLFVMCEARNVKVEVFDADGKRLF